MSPNEDFFGFRSHDRSHRGRLPDQAGVVEVGRGLAEPDQSLPIADSVAAAAPTASAVALPHTWHTCCPSRKLFTSLFAADNVDTSKARVENFDDRNFEKNFGS